MSSPLSAVMDANRRKQLQQRLMSDYGKFQQWGQQNIPDPLGALVKPMVAPMVQQFRQDPMEALRGLIPNPVRDMPHFANEAYSNARAGKPMESIASLLQAGAPMGMAGFKPLAMQRGNTMYVLHESTAVPGGYRITMGTKSGGFLGHTEYPSLEDARPQWEAYTKKAAAADEAAVNKAGVKSTPLGRAWNPAMNIPKPKWIKLKQSGGTFSYVDDNGNSWGGAALEHIARDNAIAAAKRLGVPFVEGE